MTPPKEQNTSPPNADFIEAEKMINDIAGMEDNGHIEYVSSLESKTSQSKWEKFLHWLLRLRH